MTSEAPTRQNEAVLGPDQPHGFLTGAAAPSPSEELEQFRAALVGNRRISLAIGILMRDRHLDEDQSFTCLRRVSQDHNPQAA
jgi:hypothetical protein